VLIGVLFRRVLVVFGGMQGMAVGHLGVVRRFFVIAGFVVLRGLAMVLGCFLVVMRSLLMMLTDFVAIHWFSPWQQCRCKWQSPCKSNIAGFNVTIATGRLRQVVRGPHHRHCERSKAIQTYVKVTLDCFVAEPVIGPATSGRTRWLLAMTKQKFVPAARFFVGAAGWQIFSPLACRFRVARETLASSFRCWKSRKEAERR
jgi:hypothetical protein